MYRLRLSAVRLCARCYQTRVGVYGQLPADAIRPAFEASPSPLPELSDAQLRVYHVVDSYRREVSELSNAERLIDDSHVAAAAAADGLQQLLHDSARLPAVQDRASLLQYLRQSYSGQAALEAAHLECEHERAWLAANWERMHSQRFSDEERRKFARIMLLSQNFDNFLAVKFQSIKRYGGEGAESMLVFFWQAMHQAVQCGVEQMMIGMAHRGRLNLLTGLLQFNPRHMFRKMRGLREFPADVKGSGDVLSHLAASVDLPFDDHRLHVNLLPNPSHLEAVNPVAAGKVRGRMQVMLQTLGYGDYSSDTNGSRPGDGVLCVQVHGDAAFAGQGVVPETIALSQIANSRVGGSLHCITNNQIGYTNEAGHARSTRHVSDLAKGFDCPVIHVNGENAELVANATRLAVNYRDTFRKDVFVNLVCYRRWGHNELDDPTFTQPKMYGNINTRRSIPDTYADQLISENVMSAEERDGWPWTHRQHLNEAIRDRAIVETQPIANHLRAHWANIEQAPSRVEQWDTGVDLATLKYVGVQSVAVPDDFAVHEHLAKTHCRARCSRVEGGDRIDWATAEALAIGSLLLQGYHVRLSGQDVGRGTFSQRHCLLVDQQTDAAYIPFNHMPAHPDTKAGKLEVANSILSEEAVLGFEYGMSVEHPDRLCVWEAQFGDFFNGAQIIVDTCISSGEMKWLTQSGLVMLLPHGFDGAGPEHSSARPERFLQMTDSSETTVDNDDVNFGLVNPTTPAQMFHVLRRQLIRPYRKPLVIVGPKLLLRHPQCVSSLTELGPGSHFQTVLDDPSPQLDAGRVDKVVLCSGKHYYALAKHLAQQGDVSQSTAIVRLESLCPFPAGELHTTLQRYPNAKRFVWSQEEPRNQGCWPFVQPRLANLLGIQPKYAGRPSFGMPGTAIGEFHSAEALKILQETFE